MEGLKMKKLYAVDFQDVNMPCVTYAIRRTNFQGTIRQFMDSEKLYMGEELNVGDVLVWHLREADTEGGYCVDRMVDDRPVSEYISFDRHYCVVEENGLISDTVGNQSGFINIRLRKLDTLVSKPTGIIRYI